MKRLFTFLMTTLVLLVVSTQGAKAYEYWIMGDISHETTNEAKWDKATCKKNDENKFVSNGSIHTYTFTAENTTSVWFRIAPGDGYKDKEVLYPSEGKSISIAEGASYNVGYIEGTNFSWGINVTAGEKYEITLDETDTNSRKVSYKKISTTTYNLHKETTGVYQKNTDGVFHIDLTKSKENEVVTFQLNGKFYGLSADANAPTDKKNHEYTYTETGNGKLTLLKGYVYSLTMNAAGKLTVMGYDKNAADYYLVATCNGVTRRYGLSQSRERGMKDDEDGYSLDNYTVGIKDEQLPGSKGDKVSFYVENADGTMQYRPWSGGGDYEMGVDAKENKYGSNVKNTNVTYYQTYECKDMANNRAYNFILTKGRGISYTIALNARNTAQNYTNDANNNHNYYVAPNSLTLYVNRSLTSVYRDMFGDLYHTGTEASAVEDYYLMGCLDGKAYNSSFEESNKMIKMVYLNPIDKNEVDSVVYSKVVRKGSARFGSLFLAFAPKCLNENKAVNLDPTITDPTIKKGLPWGNACNFWHYIVRPQVLDEWDATATTGSVLVGGFGKNSDGQTAGNGEQALNPLADNTYKYYIVRLNVTTSTYRIEFVDDPDIVAKHKMMTYSSDANLRIPDGVKAYEVYRISKKTSVDKDLAQAETELRSLNYIPQREGVVLVFDDALFTDKNGNQVAQVTFPIIPEEDENTGVTNVKEDWWTVKKHKEDGDTYKNYLIPCVYGKKNVPEGDYNEVTKKYVNRNFALSEFKNTTYFKNLTDAEKANVTNYYGFFRFKGNVGENRAYLSLPASEWGSDMQMMSNVDKYKDGQNYAKVSLLFDDEGETTGITETLVKNDAENDVYYNLQGMKVEKPTHGLYIHNGKKIFIK